MALRSVGRRSRAQENLGRTEEAHRQRMRPPVPNDGYPFRAHRAADGAKDATPRSKGSDATPSRSTSLPPLQSPRLARSAPAGLDLDLKAGAPPHTPDATPGSASSPGGHEDSCTVGRHEDSEDDEEFLADLQELDELTAHLARRGDPSSARDARPPTASSVSTTAPASSLATASVANGEDYADANEDPFEQLQGAVRVHQEIAQLRLPHGCRLETSQASFAQLFFSMDVAEGPFTPASLVFWVKIFAEYPLPGSVSIRATKRIFHPSIDAQTGAVAFPGANPQVKLASMLTSLVRMVKSPQPVAEPRNADASSLSEQMRLDLMQLEVMKEDFKATAASYMECNKVQLQHIGQSP
ncbi:unnamed protein product [Durusdinium trenchii]|uniref:UBC core domain-containing protein n=1 Tax=Durusdinium trenchii TaxID=1381693 RepID=A0ABP0IZR7_9DINO